MSFFAPAGLHDGARQIGRQKVENQLSPVDRGFVSVCMLNDGRYHIGTTGCHRVPQGATRCHKVPGGFGFNGRTGAHVRATAGNPWHVPGAYELAPPRIRNWKPNRILVSYFILKTKCSPRPVPPENVRSRVRYPREPMGTAVGGTRCISYSTCTILERRNFFLCPPSVLCLYMSHV